MHHLLVKALLRLVDLPVGFIIHIRGFAPTGMMEYWPPARRAYASERMLETGNPLVGSERHEVSRKNIGLWPPGCRA